MAESTEQQDPKTPSLTDLYNHPMVKELIIPAIKKEYLGIGARDKEVTKKGFGRTMYALRDFMQGTWWVMALFVASMMIIFILFLALRKALRV